MRVTPVWARSTAASCRWRVESASAMYPSRMPPTRWRSESFKTALYAAFLAATVPLLAACSHDAMLLESDVPVPSGMWTVRSADIRRSGGTVSGGRFILAGPVDDAGALMVATRARFAGSGWTTVEIKDGLDHS